MTAPDAPPVEPLRLTLEEAQRLCRQRGVWLRCKAEHDDGRTLTGDNWTEVASDVLGVPVERRDDTADLAEAVAKYVAAVEAHEAYLERNYEVRDAAEDDEAVEQIGKWWGAMKAALARVRGGES